MPRLEHRFTVSLHDRWTSKKFTVHLVQAECRGKFWPKFKGRNSQKYRDLTTTKLGQLITRWINRQQAIGFCEWDIDKGESDA